MSNRRIDEAELGRLRAPFRGELLRPEDGGYDAARRIWNARFDRRPALIARCTGVADVIAGLAAARELGLPLTVRSGGHDYAGNSAGEGGLLLDLSPLRGIWIDPRARRARVQPGVTWGAFDREAQVFGLATTGATVSSVGVAGFTLGGGSGHLARRAGLGLDNLRAAEVVTAAGEVLHASDAENPELFWALRGGSGNFGVVTSFEFELHPVGPEVLAGQIVHRFEDAADVLRAYREAMAQAPDELQCYAFIIPLPPLDAFPTELHGRPALDLVVAHTGADGERAVAPLRAIGRPIHDGVARVSYLGLQQAFDAGMPSGQRWYTRAHYLAGLPDDAIDTLLQHTAELPGPFTMVYLEPLGGAIARVGAEATAFAHRDAAYSLHILPGWSDPAEDEHATAWARALHRAMEPYSTGGVYVNLLGDDEQGRTAAAYGAHLERLARLKARFDPDNLLRSNHNIAPAG